MYLLKNILYLLLLILLFSVKSKAQVFSEDFESGIPNTWAIFDNGVGTNISWGTTITGVPATNTASIRFDCSVASDAEDWLVTPLITPTATDNFLRFFQSDPDTMDYGSIMTIRVSTGSQTNPADFTIIYTQGESVLNRDLTPLQIDLTAYINQPIYIAFVMTQNCGDQWYVDDVEVRPECNNIDLSISASGNTLTANQPGATYEWIACSPPAISGETNQSITLTDVNQFVKVKITMNDGCTEASGCYNLSTLSNGQNHFKEALTLYPNPVYNSFQIENLNQQVHLSIYDLNGKELIVLPSYNGGEVDVSNLGKGMYLVNVNTKINKQVLKLLKY